MAILINSKCGLALILNYFNGLSNSVSGFKIYDQTYKYKKLIIQCSTNFLIFSSEYKEGSFFTLDIKYKYLIH